MGPLHGLMRSSCKKSKGTGISQYMETMHISNYSGTHLLGLGLPLVYGCFHFTAEWNITMGTLWSVKLKTFTV